MTDSDLHRTPHQQFAENIERTVRERHTACDAAYIRNPSTENEQALGEAVETYNLALEAIEDTRPEEKQDEC